METPTAIILLPSQDGGIYLVALSAIIYNHLVENATCAESLFTSLLIFTQIK